MTDGSFSTMTSAGRAAYLNRIDRQRPEAALDQAVATFEQFKADHPGEDVVVVVDVINSVINSIFNGPLETLGDARLFARAWLERYRDELEDHERRLLEALAALPPRLCDEPIALP